MIIIVYYSMYLSSLFPKTPYMKLQAMLPFRQPILAIKEWQVCGLLPQKGPTIKILSVWR